MKQDKPIPANLDPETRALLERARAVRERMRKHGDALQAVVDEQKKDFAKLKKEDPLQGVMGHVLLQDREEVRATDEFGREVTAEDKLLKEQEARWAEEDRKAGRK